MGAIAAVLDKKGKEAAEKTYEMLKTLAHRFNHSYGIATQKSIFIIKNYADLTGEIPEAHATIGYGLCKTQPKDQLQPILEEDFTLALEGRFSPSQNPSDLEFACELLKSRGAEKIQEIIEKLDGSYNLAIIHKGNILVGRDPFGTRPLYYGENSLSLIHI